MTDPISAAGNVARPLRVVFVIGATRGPAWWGEVFDAIGDSPDVETVGALVSGTLHPRPEPRSAAAMLRLYQQVDRRVFGRPGDPSSAADLSGRLGAIPRIEGEGTDLVADVGVLLGAAPDAWLPSIAPRFGIWAFEHPVDHAALLAPAGGTLPPGGEELLRGDPSTSTSLVALVGSPAQRWLLGTVTSRVDVLSLRRGSRGHLRKLPILLVGALREVRMDQSLPGRPISTHPPASQATVQRPAHRVTLTILSTVLGFMSRRLRRSLLTDRWVIGVTRTHDPGSATGIAIRDVRILETPPGLDWADPFPMRLPDRDILFIEEYDRTQDRGWLAVVDLDDSPRGWSSKQTILDLPHHLSYPFVFEWDGAWYLMPEQASTGSLELYRAASFPYDWRWHSTVLEGIPAADPTLARIGDLWWLFVAAKVPGGNAADELHLFHAETPLGPWTAHGRNPVVSDIRTARSAGRIYEKDGRWFRPTQDGTHGYGHSMVIMEILQIDPDGYQEREVQSIGPGWAQGLIATHTINRDCGLTAVDGLKRESRLRRRQYQ